MTLAVVTRSTTTPLARAHADPRAPILAMWRVLPGALMLLGRSPVALENAGHVIGSALAMTGRCQCISWPDDDGFLILVAIRLRSGVDPADGTELTMRLPGSALRMVLRGTGASASGFGQQVAQYSAGRAAAIASFMMTTLRMPAGADVDGAAVMLSAFLVAAAEPDGSFEITATTPDGGVLLQGWGARLTGAVQVIPDCDVLHPLKALAGDFPRTDISGPAVGVMLALQAPAGSVLGAVQTIFVISGAALSSRRLVEHRTLSPADSLGHIRHMLPILRGPACMQAMLSEALRPRYEGRDTLSNGPYPVRASVDISIAASGTGIYVSGWVFDPARQIVELHLCDRHGVLARLDEAWTRVPRPDVTLAYRDTQGFPPPADDLSGFAVFAPFTRPAEAGPHLRFVLADGSRAFLPITLALAEDEANRATLLGSVDLWKPSGTPIVEHHVGPFLARVTRKAEKHPTILLAGPLERTHATVVPLGKPVLPRAFLSGYLLEPADDAEQLVLACGPDWDAAMLDALLATVRFYDLPATVVRASRAGAIAALRCTALATAASSFIVASPGVTGRTPGWRQRLQDAACGQAAFACPTVLYEDWSVRYAGSSVLRFHPGPPFAEIRAGLAGMPFSQVAGLNPQAASGGTLECCRLSGAALEALDDEGALATDAGQEAAFFQRLAAAGLRGVWLPDVQVYAPETAMQAPGDRVAALADGWMLRDAWKEKSR